MYMIVMISKYGTNRFTDYRVVTNFQKVTYPIMTRNQKMVSPVASLPIRVSLRYDANEVLNNVLKPDARVGGVRPVDISHNVDDTYGKKECEGLIGVFCRKWALSAQLVHELSFNGVYVVHWPLLEEWWLSLFVCPNSKSLLHLYVAPVHNNDLLYV